MRFWSDDVRSTALAAVALTALVLISREVANNVFGTQSNVFYATLVYLFSALITVSLNAPLFMGNSRQHCEALHCRCLSPTVPSPATLFSCAVAGFLAYLFYITGPGDSDEEWPNIEFSLQWLLVIALAFTTFGYIVILFTDFRFYLKRRAAYAAYTVKLAAAPTMAVAAALLVWVKWTRRRRELRDSDPDDVGSESGSGNDRDSGDKIDVHDDDKSRRVEASMAPAVSTQPRRPPASAKATTMPSSTSTSVASDTSPESGGGAEADGRWEITTATDEEAKKPKKWQLGLLRFVWQDIRETCVCSGGGRDSYDHRVIEPFFYPCRLANALVTFICLLCTLRTQMSRSICNFTHALQRRCCQPPLSLSFSSPSLQRR
jgi:hypothetical protein